jgi:hypothetical protein
LNWLKTFSPLLGGHFAFLAQQAGHRESESTKVGSEIVVSLAWLYKFAN